MNISKTIKHLRKSHNLTQHELAKKSLVDQTYIARMERGKANPSVKILEKIAHALGLTLIIEFKIKS